MTDRKAYRALTPAERERYPDGVSVRISNGVVVNDRGYPAAESIDRQREIEPELGAKATLGPGTINEAEDDDTTCFGFKLVHRKAPNVCDPSVFNARRWTLHQVWDDDDAPVNEGEFTRLPDA